MKGRCLYEGKVTRRFHYEGKRGCLRDGKVSVWTEGKCQCDWKVSV